LIYNVKKFAENIDLEPELVFSPEKCVINLNDSFFGLEIVENDKDIYALFGDS
jgi:hypothetical protein